MCLLRGLTADVEPVFGSLPGHGPVGTRAQKLYATRNKVSYTLKMPQPTRSSPHPRPLLHPSPQPQSRRLLLMSHPR